MALDVTQFLASAKRKPTSDTSAVSLALSDEQVADFGAILTAVGVDGDAVDVATLMPSELHGRSAANQAGNLSKYLRGRFCKAEGGDGRFVWISGYAGKKGEPDEGSVYLVARSLIPERAKVITSGKWNTDGTPKAS